MVGGLSFTSPCVTSVCLTVNAGALSLPIGVMEASLKQKHKICRLCPQRGPKERTVHEVESVVPDHKMAASLDELVLRVGGCGRFQVLLLILVLSPIPMAVWSMLHMVFGSVEPDWWCGPHAGSLNESRRPTTKISEEGLERLDTSQVLDRRNCSARRDPTCDVIVFEGGINTVVSEFQLVCALSWVPSMIISLQMVGVLLGATVAGQIGDTFGRKKSLYLMTFLHSVFSLLAAFSSSWTMFAACRMLIGFSIGGIIATGYGYPAEFLSSKWRALIAAVPVWGVGVVTFSLIVWTLRDWRHLHIITAACSAATLPGWFFVPESVRWLVTKGRTHHAQQVLQRIARFNGRPVPEVTIPENFLSSDVGRVYTYIHIFSSWKMTKVSLLSGLVWVFCSMTYYGISFGIKNLSGDFYLNLLLMAVLEMPPNLVMVSLLNWLGRRWTSAGSFLLAAAAVLIVIPVSITVSAPEAGVAVSTLSMVAKTSIIFGWSAVTVHHIELFPTVVRNIGMGYLNTVARIGGILAPYILFQGNGSGFGFYVIIAVAMVLNAAACLLLRETGDESLQEYIEETNAMEVRPGDGGIVETNSNVKDLAGSEVGENQD